MSAAARLARWHARRRGRPPGHRGSCSYCGDPTHYRPRCPKLARVVDEVLCADGELRHVLACGCVIRCNCDPETGDMLVEVPHVHAPGLRPAALAHHADCGCRRCRP